MGTEKSETNGFYTEVFMNARRKTEHEPIHKKLRKKDKVITELFRF